MRQIKTNIKSHLKEFKINYDNYIDLLISHKSIVERIYNGARPDAVEKYINRGKLLARQRINLLVDEGTPFLELSLFAAYNQYNNEFPYAGIITGIGVIHGIETIIVANDATVKGGTYVHETIKKHIRAQEIALQNGLPCVYLVDSGGIYLPEQANVFPDRFDFGRIFYNQARLSAEGIPQISVVMGSCTAGGAYIPAMSDEVIMVKNQGTIFIGGPPLVKAATGEHVTAEELGGALVHTSISGVADHLAEDDVDAIKMCRDVFKTLNRPGKQYIERVKPVDPVYPIEELYELIPADEKKAINAYEIIARLVDGSEMHEFKAEYGKKLITGFARMMGYPVGIIANNGFLDSDCSQKGAHFVELCNFREIPLVFLQNISGFIVGKKYEHEGIAKDGAKFIHAVANASVPKFTVVFGGSYGAGNYAMSGRAFDPNFLFMWPNSRISVMGGEQATMVLKSIREGKDGNSQANGLIEQFEKESTAYYSSSRLWDDGVIDPADTRWILALCISASLNREFEKPRAGVYRM
ncbi:MAG TPA: carboxyl transferase domain-containing protein [Bacteroidales bacterium]